MWRYISSKTKSNQIESILTHPIFITCLNRVHPRGFMGWLVCDSLIALGLCLWTFILAPSPIFCTSSFDPCTCSGGGFEIYRVLCVAAADPNASITNLTKQAMEHYHAVPRFLEQNMTPILLSASVLTVIVMVYAVANLWISLQDQKYTLKELEEKAQKMKKKLQERDFLSKKMKKMEAK